MIGCVALLAGAFAFRLWDADTGPNTGHARAGVTVEADAGGVLPDPVVRFRISETMRPKRP